MSRQAARLRQVLIALGIACEGDLRIVRTRAGRHQRAAGAWSWLAHDERREIAGSQWSVAEVLAAPAGALSIYRLDHGAPEIIAEA